MDDSGVFAPLSETAQILHGRLTDGIHFNHISGLGR
jgi:hypothetical protein